MEPKEVVDRLRAQLLREHRRLHGRKGEIDRRMGHSAGFLRRKIGPSFKLDVREMALAMEVEPREFFAEAFDILPRPEDLLRRQEKPGPAARPLARIEAAALALEATGAGGAGETGRAPETRAGQSPPRSRLESLARTVRSHQRDALRKESWVKDPDALRCYLEQLDGLRFDRAGDSAALAATVAVEVVANVDGHHRQRLELLCRAIGVFASGQRVIGEFATAARAVGFALRMAGRHGLTATRAALLQRGAYVLRDSGAFDHALELLDEALLLWLELGSSADLGRTMVDRATILGQKGDVARADAVFKVGLSYLSGNTDANRMYRVAAAHGIAFTQLRMGDPREADRWLQRAIDLAGDDEPAVLAKLIRQQGAIYYENGDFPRAETAFVNARKILAVKENVIQGALVALDVAAALEAQGKSQELHQLAEDMTGLLAHFNDNRLAAAALMAFIRAGLDGRVTERLIQDVGKKLGRARPLARARHPRALPTWIDKGSQRHRP